MGNLFLFRWTVSLWLWMLNVYSQSTASELECGRPALKTASFQKFKKSKKIELEELLDVNVKQ